LKNTKATRLLAAAAVIALFAGCSSQPAAPSPRKQAIAEVKWDFEKNAVSIEIEADERLNEFENESHTLLLGVYQMADPAPFYKMTADSEAMATSLERGAVGDGFVDLARFVVTPGGRAVVNLDRAQKAKYVGLIAGYYLIDAPNAARLFEIPLTIDSKGVISTIYAAAPAPLALRLKFGPKGLINAERLNQVPGEKPLVEAVPLDGGGKQIDLSSSDAKASLKENASVYRLNE
jgi:type VI secretion system VasD/TssJ family lipoprotein